MYKNLQQQLKNTLDVPRYEHTLGVMYTAGCMAMAHDYDMQKAMLAGLLHDCAKCMTHEERLLLCEKYHVEVTQSELDNKALLHAKAGAILAKTQYDIADEDILHAIAVHTTGEPNMNTLDKIIYIADYIEPGRDKAPNLEKIRSLAYKDLDACMAQILYDTLSYLKTRGGFIDPTTEQTYHFYSAKLCDI
ncbi:MAG: bis(5'-nucleosyl)-tetraphosphatase (symmetrical) YqeK [Lachnospiraceae bacterium]|nr:bis(5'-nucleosyl)-tetraphosphatase (symmetrical) YqeK [Lachnospiraceae bacterium]